MANTKGLRKTLIARADRHAIDAAADLERQLKESARRHHGNGSGAMVNAIKVRARRAGEHRWEIVASVPKKQAQFTDKGTKAHFIYPRRRKALSWVSGGRRMFAAWVYHPGNRGSKWFRSVMTAANVRATIRRSVNK